MKLKQSTRRKIVRWLLMGESVDEIKMWLVRTEQIALTHLEIEDIIRKAAIRQEKKK